MRRSGSQEESELAAVREALAEDAADEITPLHPVWPRIRDGVLRRDVGRPRLRVALGASLAATVGLLIGSWLGFGSQGGLAENGDASRWSDTEPTLSDIYFALVADEGSEGP